MRPVGKRASETGRKRSAQDCTHHGKEKWIFERKTTDWFAFTTGATGVFRLALSQQYYSQLSP
jgi:hypothetical protein